MKDIIGKDVYFSTYFNVKKETLDKYGAFDINLISDTQVFIDPFLLFNSELEEYKKLHNEIIEYLKFLKDEAKKQLSDKELEKYLKTYYVFPEVKELWFGYCKRGNEGAGLNIDFAKVLYSGLNDIISNLGEEKISESTHLEKITLISDKVDVDKISDFTANLIKGYLLRYTEKFAKKNIKPCFCKKIMVDRAFFNYKTKSFVAKEYYLPIYSQKNIQEYVLLTPKNILRCDSTWINRQDFYKEYNNVIMIMPDNITKNQLQEYIMTSLIEDEKNKRTRDEKKKVLDAILREYPEIIDYYIKYKEGQKLQASNLSEKQVNEIESIYKNIKNIEKYLLESGFFNNYSMDSLKEAKDAVIWLKTAIEQNGLYRDFYDNNGEPIEREEIINNMYRLCFRKSHFLYNGQVNNGNGPCDSQVSLGSDDISIVEFKLAKSTSLKSNLKYQTEAYVNANHTNKQIKVILFFNDKQKMRAIRILNELELDSEVDKTIFLIDANKENKISASKLR